VPGTAGGDAREALDVDVDELARSGALVAVRRLGGVSAERRPSPMRRSQADTVESAMPSSSAISTALMRRRLSASMASTRSGGVR